MTRRIAIVFAVLAFSAVSSAAGTLFDPQAAGFTPRVPLSAFRSPTAWFDPSRLHMSSTVTVGSGLVGGTSALQVTNFHYAFKAPLALNVSVGNAFGAGSSSRNSLFLEGLDLSYQPSANSLLRVQYRDVRSPLQYNWGAFDRGTWGY